MSTAPFDDVLRRELASIKERRKGFTAPAAVPPPAQSKRPKEIADAQQVSALGLAFSGGGIRSATFNLGVLQGLAEKGLLPFVDYLSTVSGGGYIGAWLHGIIRRANGGAPTAPARAQIEAARVQLLRGVKNAPGASSEDPITFLRTYSNYLAPRPGLFSADTWAIGFIWFRNALLNQLILVPAIAAAVVAALLMLFAYQIDFGTYSKDWGFDLGAVLVAAVCLVGATVSMGLNLRPIAKQSVTSTRVTPSARSAWAAPGIATVPLVFASMVALGSAHFDATSEPTKACVLLLIGFPIVMGSIQIAGGFPQCYVARRKTAPGGASLGAAWSVLWMSVTTGIAAALLVIGVWRLVMAWPIWFHVVFGPPLVGGCFILGVMLLIGMMGADYPDAAREWTARIGSMLGIVTAAWLGLLGLMVFGPWGVSWILANFEKTGLAGILAWAATTLGGVLAGRSPQTSDGVERQRSSRVLDALTFVAPTVFLVGYLVLIATGVHALMPYQPTTAASTSSTVGHAIVTVSAPPDRGVEVKVTPEEENTLGRIAKVASRFEARYPSVFELRSGDGVTLPGLVREQWTQLDWALVLLFGALALAVVAARRININEFSLHHFYKNRLVRCYLGASQAAKRRPHPLTGFDPLDDLPIRDLAADGQRPYYGPYPIINAALNLNAGSELATQERKAASFVFTPAFCGFHVPTTPSAQSMQAAGGRDGMDANGYRETEGYAYPSGPDVGTAVAISGAAANPNWGYHTSGPMAFLLTIFNARLGWWLGNPRWPEPSTHAGPKFALKYLFSELLGQTTGASRFVNLSDGGHFDNLGLYELVRRRTRFIIVSDAEEDRTLTFGSLGSAICKCRADFGVEIDISPEPIHIKNGVSTAHCVVGTIVYPERESAFHAGLTDGLSALDPNRSESCRGWLLYLKSSMTGDEPADVTEYRSRHSEFPHQSTADQFFSESQFESYRRLGYHVLRSAFEGVETPTDAALAASASAQPDDLEARYPLVSLFQALTRKWYAPIVVSAEAATRLANDYTRLMKDLAANTALDALHFELVNGKAWPNTHAAAASAPELSAGMDLMQLVQNVYTEFGLEHAVNRANPRNSGWMRVFVKWLKSPILKTMIWPTIQADYHALFQTFVNQYLQGGDTTPPERP